MAFACSLCGAMPGDDSIRLSVSLHGLEESIALDAPKGFKIGSLPEGLEKFVEHIEREHHMAVVAPDESEEQAYERLCAMYPEARNPATCKCPFCAKWRESLAALVSGKIQGAVPLSNLRWNTNS